MMIYLCLDEACIIADYYLEYGLPPTNDISRYQDTSLYACMHIWVSIITLYTLQLKLSDWTELPAAGIYMTKPGLQETICYQYEHTDMRPPPQLQTITRSFVSLPGLSPLNMSIDDTIVSVHQRENDQVMTAACQLLGEESKSFVTILEDAVSRRVGQDSYYCTNCRLADNCDNAHISIMFSGGIDSMMLAFLSDRCVPIEQAIDLLNVAFETSSGYNVPDRITGREALQELNPERKWNFVEVSCTWFWLYLFPVEIYLLL